VNPAPAHLESKLRFLWELSVGQVAMVFAGVMFAIVWATYLSPLSSTLSAMTGAYLGGVLVLPAFLASQTDFDLGAIVLGALRWRRDDGRYIPGASERPTGYLVARNPAEETARGVTVAINLDDLWEGS